MPEVVSSKSGATGDPFVDLGNVVAVCCLSSSNLIFSSISGSPNLFSKMPCFFFHLPPNYQSLELIEDLIYSTS